jgi:hypothetical protein
MASKFKHIPDLKIESSHPNKVGNLHITGATFCHSFLITLPIRGTLKRVWGI